MFVVNLKTENSCLLSIQGSIVGTLDGKCSFYDIIGINKFDYKVLDSCF